MTDSHGKAVEKAREWVRKALKRDYSFYDDATIGGFLWKAEGRVRIEAFLAGYEAALRAHHQHDEPTDAEALADATRKARALQDGSGKHG